MFPVNELSVEWHRFLAELHLLQLLLGEGAPEAGVHVRREGGELQRPAPSLGHLYF